MKNYAQSQALYERACGSLAGGVSSQFRRVSQPHPLFYSHGHGSRVFDVDGNEYLDFTLSQGPLILGHSHPAVLTRVTEASASGQLFAGQHLQELELAEKLQALIPSAERIRFSLSGSESVHAALRLAAVGVSAPSLAAMGPREAPHPVRWSAGLPPHIEDESLLLPWNDLALVEQTLARHHAEIAAVITEPIMCNSGCILPEPGFLAGLRRLCDQYGILWILDEVITGFRVGMGGAQTRFDVTPDLAIFGKAMASGYPISALVGREKFMRLIADGTVIHAGTMNSGNPSIAAALATIETLETEDIHPRLYAYGTRLMAGLRDAARQADVPLLVTGLGPMFHTGFTTRDAVRDYRDTLSYDTARYGRFVRGMQERGIRLIGRGLWYISAAHTEAEIDQCLDTAVDVLHSLARED